MAGYDDLRCAQSVLRKIPGHVRLIQALLYLSVLIFTVIGAMEGAFWLIPALGTLFGSWYYMGAARVVYEYRLEGPILTVQRASGMRSRRKVVDFGRFDLTKIRIMAPDGARELEQAEAESLAAQPKRIIYDVSAHDPDKICSVMYLTGVGEEAGRELKVYFQPDPEMRDCIRSIVPGRVVGYDKQ